MRVPVYERRAGIAPMSIPQKQAMPQISDNGEAVSKNLEGVFTRIQEIQNGMEDARTLELFNRFKMDSQEYHENPDNGIYNTRIGFKSFGVYQDADQWLRRKGEDYARELPSRRAQANFRKMARQHIEQRALQNSRFEADQVKKYQHEQADAAIKNSLNYAERNWNDPQAINQARRDIQQALELKMRGASTDAFKSAAAEIEDQIGVARIRQAFTQHPLLAVEMLNHKDVHLKPETEAKLRETLTKKTEVYELHAIASEYAQKYTPSQAVEARNKLIERYGADKGDKAFSTLTKDFWGVDSYQKNAREQAEQNVFKKNRDALLERFNDKSKPNPTVQEVMSAKISPQARYTFLALIDREEKNSAKALKAKRDVELWVKENNGAFYSDKELQEKVLNGEFTDDDARAHVNRREAYQRKQEQTKNKWMEQNKSDFVQKFMDGTLTDEDINKASGILITPEDALTLRGHLRAENERKQRKEKLDAEQEQKDYEDSLRIIVRSTGGLISNEQISTLLETDKISNTFAEYLWARNREYDSEQARLQREQATKRAKEQAEKEKADRKIELDKQAANIYSMYPGDKGKALQYVDYLEGIPIDDKNTLHSMVSRLFDDEAQAVRDKNERLKEAKRKAYLGLWEETMNFSTQEQIDKARSDYQEKNTKGEFQEGEYSQLITILDKKERFLKQAAEDRKKADNYDIAKEYADRYGLDEQHEARKELREKYTDIEQIKDIMSSFDKLIQEKQHEKNSQDKALSDQQDKNYADIINGIRHNAQPVPESKLMELEQSKGLKYSQIESIRRLNAAMTTKEGVEKFLREDNINDFNSKSFAQQQAMISQFMGTPEEKRNANFAALFQKAVEGTLTNAEIEHAKATGQIWDDDAENLREYGANYDRQQRNRLMLAKNSLMQAVREMTNGDKNTSKIMTDAMLQFSIATSNIDTKAKNFDETVEKIFQGVLNSVVDNYSNGKKLTETQIFTWPPFSEADTPLGERVKSAYQTAENFSLPQTEYSIPLMNTSGDVQSISPSGQITSYDNTLPEPQIPQREQAVDVPGFWRRLLQRGGDLAVNTVNSLENNLAANENANWSIPSSDSPILSDNSIYQIKPAPQVPTNIGLQMVENGTVTGRFTDWRAYRSGWHNGIDIAGKGNIKAPPANMLLTVSRVNTNSPSKGGGNSVILSGNDGRGTKYDFIISHMENGSITVKPGDIVLPGNVIGKVGNTGMTSDREKGGITAWYEGKKSGYHMDLKIKVNGKYVDPETFVPPPPTPEYTGPTIEAARSLPQPLVEPVVSSDQEVNAALWDILFGGSGSDVMFGNNSSDLFDTNGRFGGGY